MQSLSEQAPAGTISLGREEAWKQLLHIGLAQPVLFA